MTWQPWTRAWHQALYGPHGFYRTDSPAQHFATSVQGIPGASELFAQAVAALAARHGLRHVVDVGAGGGELLAHLATLTDLRLAGVEVAGRPRALPPDIRWIGSPGGALLPDELGGLTGTLVIAHEWLDVVPCPVAVFEGGWRLLEVDDAGAERPGGPPERSYAAWCEQFGPADPQDGDRLEIGLPRDLAFAGLCSRVRDGLVLAVDYGYRVPDRPTAGTLTGYRMGAMCPPVPDGSCDLTAHVCIDSLGADHAERQRDALRGLLPPQQPAPRRLARADPTAYLQALVTRSARTALTDPAGLGSFWWLTRGIP